MACRRAACGSKPTGFGVERPAQLSGIDRGGLAARQDARHRREILERGLLGAREGLRRERRLHREAGWGLSEHGLCAIDRDQGAAWAHGADALVVELVDATKTRAVRLPEGLVIRQELLARCGCVGVQRLAIHVVLAVELRDPAGSEPRADRRQEGVAEGEADPQALARIGRDLGREGGALRIERDGHVGCRERVLGPEGALGRRDGSPLGEVAVHDQLRGLLRGGEVREGEIDRSCGGGRGLQVAGRDLRDRRGRGARRGEARDERGSEEEAGAGPEVVSHGVPWRGAAGGRRAVRNHDHFFGAFGAFFGGPSLGL